MTTRAEIKQWFDEAAHEGAAYMIIFCDTFDYEDFPVFCPNAADAHKRLLESSGAMLRAMEVYDVARGWESQASGRAWNLPPTGESGGRP